MRALPRGVARARTSHRCRGCTPALAGAALLLAFGAACTGEPRAAAAVDDPPAFDSTADVVAVRRGPLRQVLLLSGELRSVGGATITVPDSPQRDPVIRWMIDEGAPVQPGDQLVELDTSEIASQLDSRQISLEEAINELNNRSAEIAGEIAQMELEVERARINLRKAEIDASVPQDLQSQREHQEFQLALEQAQNELAKIEADYEALIEGSEAELDVLRIDVQMAEREVAEVRRALETMVLRAPIAGLAVAADNRREGRKFQVGDATWDNAEIMLIPDLSVMVVDTRMSDVDDGKVTPAMRVLCTLDAYPERQIPGYVRTITPVAVGLNMRSEQRYFRIIVELEESDPEIMRPGMSVKASIVTGARDDALLAPRAALAVSGDPQRARLRDGGEVEVELGPCNAHVCVVESGLEAGDRLAHMPAATLPEGAPDAAELAGGTTRAERGPTTDAATGEAG